jgi:hypothetical protein
MTHVSRGGIVKEYYLLAGGKSALALKLLMTVCSINVVVFTCQSQSHSLWRLTVEVAHLCWCVTEFSGQTKILGLLSSKVTISASAGSLSTFSTHVLHCSLTSSPTRIGYRTWSTLSFLSSTSWVLGENDAFEVFNRWRYGGAPLQLCISVRSLDEVLDLFSLLTVFFADVVNGSSLILWFKGLFLLCPT